MLEGHNGGQSCHQLHVGRELRALESGDSILGPPDQTGTAGQAFALSGGGGGWHKASVSDSGWGGQGGFVVRSLVDGAGSYSVVHRAELLPSELTGMWGWILLRSPHQGRWSPPAPAPTKQRPAARASINTTSLGCIFSSVHVQSEMQGCTAQAALQELPLPCRPGAVWVIRPGGGLAKHTDGGCVVTRPVTDTLQDRGCAVHACPWEEQTSASTGPSSQCTRYVAASKRVVRNASLQRCCRGAFSHSANYHGVHPGNTPANPPPYRSVHDPFQTASRVRNSGPATTGGGKQPAFRTARAQRTVRPPRGRFRTARAQRAHSANYYGGYPGNNPENHPPAESCTINLKLKNSNISLNGCCSGRGYRGQNLGPWDPWQARPFNLLNLPNSRWWRTADFSHSAGTAHGAPPKTRSGASTMNWRLC